MMMETYKKKNKKTKKKKTNKTHKTRFSENFAKSKNEDLQLSRAKMVMKT